MSIINSGVRIIVGKPFGLTPTNLFGRITSRRGDSLFVTLSKPLTAKGITSDQMVFKANDKASSFSQLENNYAVFVDGALIPEGTKDEVFVLNGTLSLD